METTRDITSVYARYLYSHTYLKTLVNNDDLSNVSTMNPKID